MKNEIFPNNYFVFLQFPINSIVPLLTLSLYLTFAFKITIYQKKINKLMDPVHPKVQNLSQIFFDASKTDEIKSPNPSTTKRTTFKAQNKQDDTVDDEVHSFHYEDSSKVNEESNSNKSLHEVEHFRATMVLVIPKENVKSYMEIWKGSYKNSTVSLIAIMVHIFIILYLKNILKTFHFFLIVSSSFSYNGKFDLDTCNKQDVSEGNNGK